MTYWLEDPVVLFRPNADGSYIPNKALKENEMENSVARVILIVTGVALLSTKSEWSLAAGAAALFLRHYMYMKIKQTKTTTAPLVPKLENPIPYGENGEGSKTFGPQYNEEQEAEQDLQASVNGEIDRFFAMPKHDETTPAAIFWGAEDDPLECASKSEGPFFTKYEQGTHLKIIGEALGTIEQQ